MALIVASIWILTILVRIILTYIPESDLVKVVEEPDVFGTRVNNVMKNADTHLVKHVSYYRNLSPAGKEKFRSRMRVVLATKRFYAPKDERLSHEKVLIASSAFVLVTFGLENWQLPFLKKIIIYDDLVSEKYFKKKFKGLTNSYGVIRLSWRYLRDGFLKDDDGVNLGLHELAHGIEVSLRNEQIVAERIAQLFEEFERKFHDVRSDLVNRKLRLFSKRDLSIRTEFFASCVELFFEQPEQLQEHHPELFDLLCYCLNQNPSRSNDDFRVESTQAARLEAQFRSKRASSDYLNPFQQLSLQSKIQFAIVFGMVLGGPFMVYYGSELLHPVSSTLSIALAFGVIGAFGFKKRLFDSGYSSFISYLLFLVIGWTPLSTGIALTINDAIVIEEKTAEFEIQSARYSRNFKAILVEFKGGNQAFPPRTRLVPSKEVPLWKQHEKDEMVFRIYTSKGLFFQEIYRSSSLDIKTH